MRRATGLLQLVELAIALALAWLGFHDPKAAPYLFGAGGLISLWALIADGPLALAHLVGLRVHRIGILVVAVAVAALPFVTGDFHDLVVDGSCLVAAAALARFGLVRWPTVSGPATGAAAPTAPSPTTESPTTTELLGRRAGQVAGRAGTTAGRAGAAAGQKVGDKIEVVVPAGARAAGRVAARWRRQSN
jgi:hypothetical protein